MSVPLKFYLRLILLSHISPAMSRPRLLCCSLTSGFLLLTHVSQAQVVINELQAAPNSVTVEYDPGTGMPRIGYGPAWWEAGFFDQNWLRATAPIGHSTTGLATDLAAAMDDKTPSLYLRKTFSLLPSDLTQAADLLLKVWYNDGFVAILNGKEIARMNMGPAQQVTYRDQVSYRASDANTTLNPSDPQPVELNLGNLQNLLVPGENLLAIQGHNRDLGGSFKLDAQLYSLAPLTFTTLYEESFDTANGAGRRHQRTGATETNTALGTPPPNSWLTNSPDPTSDAAWPGLTITRTLPATGGTANTGYLKIDITQTTAGALAASIPTPLTSFASVAQAGQITSEHLSRAEFKLRFRTSSGAALGLRIEPENGTPAQALTGFPLISAASTLAEDAAMDFAASSGGNRSRVVNSTGSVNTVSSGLVRFSPLFEHGAALKNATYRYTEVNAAGQGYGGSTGCLKLEITDPPDAATEHDYVQFGRAGHTVRSWTAGSVVQADLEKVNLNFAYNLPAGLTARILLEPDLAASTALDRLDLGLVTGTGLWQLYDQPLSVGTNAGSMLARLNGGTATAFRIFFRIQSSLPVGQALFIDNLGFNSSWRSYSAQLSSASAASVTAFLNAMNAGAKLNFRPVFFKSSSAISPAVDTFSIDDYRISFRSAGGNQNWINSGSQWAYFIGRHEPNAGIIDPAALALTTLDVDMPDWLELKNTGTSPAILTGHSLTDDADVPAKWTFPAGTTIPAGGHLIVFCDAPPTPLPGAQFLHANFSLKSDDEYVSLRDPQGGVISEVLTYPKQNGFFTWGLNPAGSGEYGYLRNGTPGRDNSGPFLLERVRTPDFTPSGGFFDNPVLVSMASETAGATIRYTLDGSEPTNSSTIFTAPFTIASVSTAAGTVIRAKAWKAGAIPSDVKTSTYLVGQHAGLKQAPALVLTGDPGKSLSLPYGITAISGGSRDTAGVWTANNTSSYNNVLGDLNNALTGGQAWERPFAVEWRYPDQRPGFNEEAGIRVSGSGHARPRYLLTNINNAPWPVAFTEKPSFNIFFRKEYGNSEVSHPLFQRGYPVENFEQLRVRAGKNDTGTATTAYVVDEFMRRAYINMGQQGSRGLFNSLYVNGKFRGVYNTCERLREPFMRQHFNSTADWDVRQVTEIANGDATAFNAFTTAMDAYFNAPSDVVKWQAASNLLDMTAYIDYALVNTWGGTGDWPHNNFVASRERTPTGKWRWFVWDAEGAFGGFSKTRQYNVIHQDLKVNPTAAGREICRTFTRFSKNQDFRMLFADRIHKHFCNDGAMSDSKLTTLRNEVVAEYLPLYQYLYPTGTLNTAWFSNWVNATNLDKRDTLFGDSNLIDDPTTTTVGDLVEMGYQFAMADLWPSSHGKGTWGAPFPPSFSQHGGDVPSTFSLRIDHTEPYATDADRPRTADNPYRVSAVQDPANREIWFTTDGSDPRVLGGGLSSTAQRYTGPISLNRSFITVKARIRNTAAAAPTDISALDNRWSPLTEATFRVASISPEVGMLVIAELLYNPSEPSAAESAAGVAAAGDFEFIRILNTGPLPVNLAETRFDAGIGFDFLSGFIPVLDPRQSVFIVSNLAAFRARYGTAFDSQIAGEFTGTSLNNGGERLRLIKGTNSVTTLIEFTYGDKDPWPLGADGDGSSLLLIAPYSSPNHSLPENWTASALPGGTLGTNPAMNYARWRSLFWDSVDASLASTAMDADFDNDGVSNRLEYALGRNPRLAEGPAAKLVTESLQGMDRGIFEYRSSPGATETNTAAQISFNLTQWNAAQEIAPPTLNADGTLTHRCVAPLPVGAAEDHKRVFFRLTEVP